MRCPGLAVSTPVALLLLCGCAPQPVRMNDQPLPPFEVETPPTIGAAGDWIPAATAGQQPATEPAASAETPAGPGIDGPPASVGGWRARGAARQPTPAPTLTRSENAPRLRDVIPRTPNFVRLTQTDARRAEDPWYAAGQTPEADAERTPLTMSGAGVSSESIVARSDTGVAAAPARRPPPGEQTAALFGWFRRRRAEPVVVPEPAPLGVASVWPLAGCNPCVPCPPLSCYDGTCPPGSCPIESGLWDNTYLFALYDGFDLADQTRHGGRFGINWALPPFDDYFGLGIQLGASGSFTNEDEQFFATGGLFWRGDMRYGRAWNYGAVVDFLHDGFYEVDVAQVRAKLSYTWNLQNELGLWGAAAGTDDDLDIGIKVEAVNQANVFYRHLWRNGFDSTIWVGWRDGQADFTSGSTSSSSSRSDSGVALGTELHYPLGEVWSLTGGGHYAFESDSWNAFAGIALYLGARGRQAYLGQHRHLPFFGVADNTSMTLSFEP